MKKVTYKQFNILIIMLILIGGKSLAQTKKSMTLNEVLEQVLNNSWDIKKMNQHVNMAAADVSQANSVFLPSLSFSETFTTTTDPMMAFGTKLGQSSITNEDFNPDRLNNPDRISNFNTRVELEQPLFNMDGIYGRQAAKKSYEAATYDHAWAKSNLTIQTKHLYYSLGLSIEAEGVVIQALNAAEASAKVSLDLYDQGLISKADLMAVQLQATQLNSKQLHAAHTIEQLNLSLLQMMGVEELITIEPSELISGHQIEQWIATERALEQRADLKSLKLKSEAAELNMKSKKGGFIPRVNAFGNYGFNDTNAFGTQANNYMLGVQLKWDIFNGGKNIGAAQKARYQNEYSKLVYQEELSEAERNIRKLKNDLALAEQQISLAELAVTQATEMKKVREDRYAEGLEKTSDVLMSASYYLQKNLELLQIKNQYLRIRYELEAQLGIDQNS